MVSSVSRNQRAFWSAIVSGSNNAAVAYLNLSADIDLQGDHGRNALMIASNNGFEEIALMLLQRNASTSLKDSDGWTSLHRCCDNGHLSIVTHLIDHGANINSQNNALETPLMRAAWLDYAEICYFLISRGADPYIFDSRNQTALNVYGSAPWIEMSPTLKQERIAMCELARVEYLSKVELEQRQLAKDLVWGRRWPLLCVLAASRYLPTSQASIASPLIRLNATLNAVGSDDHNSSRARLVRQLFCNCALLRTICEYL